jgi:isoleucyl-tRNA synthetase
VYFTGLIRDKQRRKMSKSLGNSPDALELIEKFGADAVRMGLLLCSPAGNDILSSWYIAPRNGHISIFTLPAITLLFRRYEINIIQTAFGVFGFKKLPTFKNKLFV